MVEICCTVNTWLTLLCIHSTVCNGKDLLNNSCTVGGLPYCLVAKKYEHVICSSFLFMGTYLAVPYYCTVGVGRLEFTYDHTGKWVLFLQTLV